MKITHEIRHGICIIYLEGLLIREEVEHLRNYLESLLDQGLKGLIFNLKKVDEVDSVGITLIAAILSLFKSAHVAVSLCEVNRKLRLPVYLSESSDYHLYPTEAAALSALQV